MKKNVDLNKLENISNLLNFLLNNVSKNVVTYQNSILTEMKKYD